MNKRYETFYTLPGKKEEIFEWFKCTTGEDLPVSKDDKDVEMQLLLEYKDGSAEMLIIVADYGRKVTYNYYFDTGKWERKKHGPLQPWEDWTP